MKTFIRMALFTLIVVVLANITVNAQNSDFDSKTATVKVHPIIWMDPIIPNGGNVGGPGNTIKPLIQSDGDWHDVWGTARHKTRILWWNVVLTTPAINPFAVFGVNGTKNEEIDLKYSYYANNSLIEFEGGWALGNWNGSNFTAQVPLPNNGSATTTLGIPMLNNVGRCWVGAYVTQIMVPVEGVQDGVYTLTFKLEAAYKNI